MSINDFNFSLFITVVFTSADSITSVRCLVFLQRKPPKRLRKFEIILGVIQNLKNAVPLPENEETNTRTHLSLFINKQYSKIDVLSLCDKSKFNNELFFCRLKKTVRRQSNFDPSGNRTPNGTSLRATFRPAASSSVLASRRSTFALRHRRSGIKRRTSSDRTSTCSGHWELHVRRREHRR